MISKEDIQKLTTLFEAALAMNEALRTAFISTEPTVNVTLPDGETFIMPTYQALYAKYEALKNIGVGLQVYNTDDYQLILNQYNGILCQVSRHNPIVPTTLFTKELVEYFDIQTDTSKMCAKLLFDIKSTPADAKNVAITYTYPNKQFTIVRPIHNNNLTSKKVGEIAISNGVEYKDTWQLSLVIGQTLAIGDYISIGGQLTRINNIVGNTYYFRHNVSTKMGSSVYKTTLSDSTYVFMPIRPCQTIQISVMCGQRLSEPVILNANTEFYENPDYANLLTGLTLDDAFNNPLAQSIVLPAPNIEQATTIDIQEPLSGFEISNSLVSAITEILTKYNVYKESCNDGIRSEIVGIWLSSIKPVATHAQQILMQPFKVNAKHPSIAKGYELRYKADFQDVWTYQKFEIPLYTQLQANVAESWGHDFLVPFMPQKTELQVRTWFMYNQPSMQIVSNWSETVDINEHPNSDLYSDFLRAFEIGSRLQL